MRPEKWRVAPDPGNALASRIVETRSVGDRFEFIADAQIGRIAVVEMSREEPPGGRSRRPQNRCGDMKWIV